MKHGIRLLIGMLLLAIFLINMVASASAYSYSGDKWNTGSVGYCLDSSIPSGWSTSIAQAANTWNNAGANFYFYTILCNNKLYYAGLSGNRAASTYHTHSGVYLARCEIYFNNNIAWSTSGAPGYHDVRNIATHEYGHWLRLLDLNTSADTEKTMYYKSSKGETKKQSLHSDDIAGIRSIYP